MNDRAQERAAGDDEVTMLLESNRIEDEPSLAALRYAIWSWEVVAAARVLTHATILEAHSRLMETRDTIPEHWKGEYRHRPVWIGGREAPLASTVRPAMDELLDALNDPTNARMVGDDREAFARSAHVEFERIHPFADGNGRIGRMVLNWHRLKMGLPVLVIYSDERRRNAYYRWFERL